MGAVVVLLVGCFGCGPNPTLTARDRIKHDYMEPAEPSLEPAAEYYVGGKILLGSPRLTAGIPGRGPLELDQIRAWLDQPENHEPLEFALPLGLRDAKSLISLPPDNPLTRAKIELGRQLFFDERLARDGNKFSCGDCHHPRDWFAFFGHNMDTSQKGLRAPTPVFNRLFSSHQMLDGQAASLEAQALLPVVSPTEMANDLDTFLATIQAVEGYRLEFERIFGGVTLTAAAQALASFERVLVTGPAPIDYQRICEALETRDPESLSVAERKLLAEARAGRQAHPLSASALRGWRLFNSARAGCSACHPAPMFTDEQFHNLGIENEPAEDEGRAKVTGKPEDRGAFKTPTLRNITHTRPYMHRGQLLDLARVIDWYDDPPLDRRGLDPLLVPLNLTPRDKADLIELLRAFDSPIPQVETGRLPP